MNSLFSYLFAVTFATYMIGCSSLPQPKTIEQIPQGIHSPAKVRYIVMDTKPLPGITWQNIRPPFDWWDFYRDAERRPFQFQTTGLDMLNAWWLIDASTLVYSDSDIVQKIFVRVGLTVVRFFDEKSTQCFVASNDRGQG